MLSEGCLGGDPLRSSTKQTYLTSAAAEHATMCSCRQIGCRGEREGGQKCEGRAYREQRDDDLDVLALLVRVLPAHLHPTTNTFRAPSSSISLQELAARQLLHAPHLRGAHAMPAAVNIFAHSCVVVVQGVGLPTLRMRSSTASCSRPPHSATLSTCKNGDDVRS